MSLCMSVITDSAEDRKVELREKDSDANDKLPLQLYSMCLEEGCYANGSHGKEYCSHYRRRHTSDKSSLFGVAM